MIVLSTTEREYPDSTLRLSKVTVMLEEKRLACRAKRLRPGDLRKNPPAMVAEHSLGRGPYIEDGDRPAIWIL